ncbi:DUF7230 family protein [Methylomonas sp. MED-D]|uniref:DUF7230 family protein n=1 Tax=Methylomonas sp. MED-D TaxID=3418768 RepID=UPI003D042A20
MKKQKQGKGLHEPPAHNPVAKFAHRYNKHQIFADKRAYQRKGKHRGQEPFAIVSAEPMAKGLAELNQRVPTRLGPVGSTRLR